MEGFALLEPPPGNRNKTKGEVTMKKIVSLLVAALHAMREEGYGYAVIGWCDEAQDFYRKTVNAIPIPGSEPTHSVYRELFRFQKEDI